MKKFLLLVGVFLFLVAPVASAQVVPTVDTCRAKIGDEFAKIRDEYRAHIFGSREGAPGGFTVVSGGYAKLAIKGIIETKGRMSSELVYPLVKSYRALSCKMLEVCKAVSGSLYTSDAMLTVDVLGCEPATVPRFSECSLVSSDSISNSYESAITIQSECDVLVQDTLAAERAALKAAVAYDSGYRSLLQFSGMMDWMQDHLSEQALKPLRDMINLLGKLHQIPCFIGQCDNPVAPK